MFGATLVVKKMDQTYCLCDMFISIAFDHATSENKIGQEEAQPLKASQLINPDPEALPSWSRL